MKKTLLLGALFALTLNTLAQESITLNSLWQRYEFYAGANPGRNYQSLDRLPPVEGSFRLLQWASVYRLDRGCSSDCTAGDDLKTNSLPI